MLKILQNNPLFKGIEISDIRPMLDCLKAEEKVYKKNSIILMMGDHTDKIGILLFGRAQIIKEDIMGNRSLISDISEGEMFAETFAFTDLPHIPVTVQAVDECRVLWFDYSGITHPCEAICEKHTKLIENMLFIISQKNISLNYKIFILSKKTIRERLIAYLSAQAQKFGLMKFAIPFNRDQLADYLSTDRSSLSRELSRMQDEGILKYNMNYFELLLKDQFTE